MCACTGCPMHDICKQKAEAGNDMCTWCDIERTVENRWQEMLAEESAD